MRKVMDLSIDKMKKVMGGAQDDCPCNWTCGCGCSGYTHNDVAAHDSLWDSIRDRNTANRSKS